MTYSPPPTHFAADIADFERRLRNLESGQKMYSASVGAGGLVVGQGGSVSINGGSLYMFDGGGFNSYYDQPTSDGHPGNQLAVSWGPLRGDSAGGGTFDQGFVLWSKETQRAVMWMTRSTDRKYQVGLGYSTDPVDYVTAYAGTWTTTVTGATQWNAQGQIVFAGAGPFYTQMDTYLANGAGQGATFLKAAGNNTWLTGAGNQTTPNAANCYLDPNGFIARSTSSRRYKMGIRDAGLDVKAILALRPRSYLNRDEVRRGNCLSPLPPGETYVDLTPDAYNPPVAWVTMDSSPVSGIGTHPASGVCGCHPPKRYVGFIAEEADALGLTEFVDYDEQGRPDAFSYPAYTAALQTVVRAQADQIATLQQQVAALLTKYPVN